MTFSQLLDVASVHCAWHFSLCGCSSMWSPPVYSNFYWIGLPRSSVQFVLAWFPRWQNCGDAAAHSLSHVWPLISTACVCMHGLPACLFVLHARLFVSRGFPEKFKDRKNGTAVKCVFRWFRPSSECPCIWFVTEHGSMAHTKTSASCRYNFIERLWWYPVPDGSPPTSQKSRWHWLWNMDTSGSQFMAANRDTL